ncbi:ABC transporter G family [Raphidocelis subcapitata]|uniref:ABC transporter G family n=1 Tax=Raphidocelis subcapitata TaxID=307507 RepID=A0A2V0PEF6_9CHLO|nr:ABC transporter G family [Raphidocelis subcapitata]|eukprot:GBF96283.1 ABC transporter G family [Raphidocelis subcapitata]
MPDRVLIQPTAGTAGLTPGSTTVIALWVPVVVFAHLFAGFWLLKTWLLNSPSLFGRKGARSMRSKSGVSQRLASSVSAAKSSLRSQPALGGAAAAEGSPRRATPVIDAVATVAEGPETETETEAEPEAVFEALESVEASRSPPAAHSLSVAPLALEWQGIGCSYSTPTGPRQVLADVWGSAQPGEMQALLGPSGAGKSTFMDILALRKSVGNLTGRLLVNGVRATRRFVRKTSYVPQEDNFVPTMTTWEVMSFYADIILPAEWSKQRRRVRIREVLSEMGLAHAHRTIIGGTLPGGLMMRGLSGGERKRLAIAVGILAAPSVLFLDEPTSGLDSFAALTVMGYMKRMVLEQSQVVVASIHQPRSAIWQMFDTATLLASGRLMYTGPREGLTPWFSSLGYAYDPNLHGVSSDWALDLVAIGFAKPERFYGATMTTRDQLMAAASAFKAHYLASHGLDGDEPNSPAAGRSHGGRGPFASSGGGAPPPAGQGGSGIARALCCGAGGAARGGGLPVVGSHTSLSSLEAAGPFGGSRPPSAAGVGLGDVASKFATSAPRQCRTLLGRELLSITRNPFDVAGRTLTFVWVGIIMGALYYGTPFTATSARNRLNLIYMLLSFYCLMPYISMGLYTADKKFYLSDASSQLYRPGAYYVAKIAAITPFQIICACVFGLTVYGMAGLRHGAEATARMGLICTLMYLIAAQVLHACAIVAPNQDVAFMLSILWTTIQLLLSGFFVNFHEVLLNWITGGRYLSATYFAFEALLVNEFRGAFLSCANGLSATEVNFLLGAFPNTPETQKNQMRTFMTRDDPNCVLDTKAVIEYFRFGRGFGASVAILGGYLAACHALTFGAMLLAARRERR